MTTTKNILASALFLLSGSAIAASALYEVEVTGFQGLSLYEGNTVWQPTPAYPSMALRRGVEGEVLVEYSVNAEGKAENIRILDASPRGFFDGATVRALENASFGVAYSEGKPVQVDGVKKRFIYEIEKDGNDGKTYAVTAN